MAEKFKLIILTNINDQLVDLSSREGFSKFEEFLQEIKSSTGILYLSDFFKKLKIEKAHFEKAALNNELEIGEHIREIIVELKKSETDFESKATRKAIDELMVNLWNICKSGDISKYH